MGAGAILNGKDFNLFKELTITATSFNTSQADIIIPFSTQFLSFMTYGTSSTTQIINYSFNGNTLHGNLTPTLSSAFLTFPNRVVSKIFFCLAAGSASTKIRVEAYGIR